MTDSCPTPSSFDNEKQLVSVDHLGLTGPAALEEVDFIRAIHKAKLNGIVSSNRDKIINRWLFGILQRGGHLGSSLETLVELANYILVEIYAKANPEIDLTKLSKPALGLACEVLFESLAREFSLEDFSLRDDISNEEFARLIIDEGLMKTNLTGEA